VESNDLLNLLKEAFPFAKLPKNFQEAKYIIQDLGLDHKKIHACPKDCMLYWKEHEMDNYYSKCNVSRWKSDNAPAKVLRHFSLKSRLQRLFMCAQTAESIIGMTKNDLRMGTLGILLMVRLGNILIHYFQILQMMLVTSG